MGEVTCRGSFTLGTACGKCSRCRREVESYNAMKAVRDKLNTPSSALTRIEELEANLAEQIEWVKQLADDLIAAEGREARLKEKLSKAVWALDKIKRIDNLVGVFAACERTIAELSSVSCANTTGGKDE